METAASSFFPLLPTPRAPSPSHPSMEILVSNEMAKELWEEEERRKADQPLSKNRAILM